MATDDSVLVFTETTSNLHHDNFISSIDQLIAPLQENGFSELQPELLITMGGMVVSKKIKAFLRTYPPKHHWHVDPKKAYDTYFVLDHHFKTTPALFLKQFLPKIEMAVSSYRTKWLEVKKNRLQKHTDFEAQASFSDFTVFSEIFKFIPDDLQLQLGNSATVRYAQLFDLPKTLTVFCNRGTSGIDGSTSTAIGAAHASETPLVFCDRRSCLFLR